MNEEHAREVATIEALAADYTEPPKATEPSENDLLAVIAAISRIDPQIGQIDLAAALTSLIAGSLDAIDVMPQQVTSALYDRRLYQP